MILVKVVYRCKPGQREVYYKEALDAGIIDATRKEKGNLRYEFSYPVDSGDELLLLEQWENADALEHHKTAPHVRDLQAIKAKYVLATIVEKLT